MVTGDNLETARAVAKQSLIIPPDHKIFDIWGWKMGESKKDYTFLLQNVHPIPYVLEVGV